MIDSCIKFDRSKIFSAPVKSKDAPRYHEVIRFPIDLGTMKNKAKRSEYYDRESLIRDFGLLQSNAETYNGIESEIAQKARDLVNNAEVKLNEKESEIVNLEVLVREKIDTGFLKAKSAYE